MAIQLPSFRIVVKGETLCMTSMITTDDQCSRDSTSWALSKRADSVP
jgi:hypothetical protein